MDPKRQGGTNIWFITTIILVIALVGVLALKKGSSKLVGADGKEYPILNPKEASDKIMRVFLEVGGTDASNVSLEDVSEESGLYKMYVTYGGKEGEANSGSGVWYVSKDGRLFVPQVVDIEKLLAKSREEQGAENQAASTSTPETGTGPIATPTPDDSGAQNQGGPIPE